MRKFEQFFKELADVRANFRGNQFEIDLAKAVSLNSIANNRTVTVNQTVKYLKHKRKYKLARQLKAVYSAFQPVIVSHRPILGSKRTDAIDLTELVNIYRDLVMNNSLYRRSIAQILRNVE